jgi:hypothetical protein
MQTLFVCLRVLLDQTGQMFYLCSVYFNRAINRNRNSLTAILVAVFAMLGAKPGGAVAARIARGLHTAALRLLHPAEAAVRRLIVVVARELAGTVFVPRPFPAGGIAAGKGGGAVRKPLFALEDPQVPMMLSEAAGASQGGPRIRVVLPMDPTITAIFAARAATPIADGRVSSAPLIDRLEAMRLALDDLKLRLVYTSPLRPGVPPWLNRKRGNDADDVLERCHWLVHEAGRLKPDSS